MANLLRGGFPQKSNAAMYTVPVINVFGRGQGAALPLLWKGLDEKNN